MMQSIAIALVTGAASALMFMSASSGVMLSAILVWLSPLPIMIAAIGWGSRIGLLSAGAATLTSGLMISPLSAVVILAGLALPAWWLGHLMMLAQPSQQAQPSQPAQPSQHNLQQFDWYPIGRVLVWIVAIVVACGALVLLLSGGDGDDAPRQEMARMLRASGWLPPGADPAPVIDAVFRLLPAVMAFMGVIALTFNLWVAGRVVRLSQRLHRPWPALSAVALPQAMLAVLAAATISAFVDESVAPFARMIIGAVLAAYLLVGLAVIHSVTANLSGRMMWLGAVYFILLFALPIAAFTAFAIALIGVAEQFFGFRAQFAMRLPPPRPTN